MDLGSLKVGRHIIIDDEPCRIVEYERSKPGKHGAAKARIVGIGIFTGQKRNIVSPVDSKVSVPIIEKRTGQVITVMRDAVQLMDLETYETFEAPIPVDDELKGPLDSGLEVEYWRILGKVKIVRRK